MSNSTFNDRFNAWKNGASYWKDIRGIDLYNNSNTKQEDLPTMTHNEMLALNRLVNSIIQNYDNGKDNTLPEVTVTAEYPYKDRVYNVADNSISNFVSRLKDENRKTIPNWEDNSQVSTHKMGYADNVAFPMILEQNGLLYDYTDPKYHKSWKDAYDNAVKNNDAILFKTEGDARYFTEHYKTHYKGFDKYNEGKDNQVQDTPSRRLIKYISSLEGSDFAGLNKRFHGDAVKAKYKGGKLLYDTVTDFITRFEGFSPTVYKNKGDVPTIGYGTTDSAYIKLGRITKEQGRHAVKLYLNKQDARLRSIIPSWDDLPDSSKDALRSYNYNYYITQKSSPKLINALRVGDYDEAARQMNAGWNQDRVNNGLRKRRIAEKQMFLSGLRSKNPIKPLNYILNINKNEQKVNLMIGLTKDGNYIAPSESPIYTPIQSNNLKGSLLYRPNPVQTTPLERVVINTNRSMFLLPDITDVIERILNDLPIILIPTL